MAEKHSPSLFLSPVSGRAKTLPVRQAQALVWNHQNCLKCDKIVWVCVNNGYVHLYLAVAFFRPNLKQVSQDNHLELGFPSWREGSWAKNSMQQIRIFLCWS